MTLNQFLSALQSNNIQVTLIDKVTQNEIITFKAPGYASLEDILEAREIESWSIVNPTSIKIILAAETSQP